jgi:ribosomal protein S12 methylthiotransferase accessory factor
MEKIINVSFPGGKKVIAQMGDKLIATDQSVESGGEGSAPEPFTLFLASLATCAVKKHLLQPPKFEITAE